MENTNNQEQEDNTTRQLPKASLLWKLRWRLPVSMKTVFTTIGDHGGITRQLLNQQDLRQALRTTQLENFLKDKIFVVEKKAQKDIQRLSSRISRNKADAKVRSRMLDAMDEALSDFMAGQVLLEEKVDALIEILSKQVPGVEEAMNNDASKEK